MSGPLDPGSAEVDALVTDRYLDALLAAGDRHALDAPSDPKVDPHLRRAARRLRDDLVRIHPSFRFEERLAARLAGAAARMALSAAAGAEGDLIPLPADDFPDLDRAADDAAASSAVRAGGVDGLGASAPIHHGTRPDAQAGGLPRPLLIGGALTSAAISIAGAAYVAWRVGPGRHQALSPMARAVRAARQARLGAVRID